MPIRIKRGRGRAGAGTLVEHQLPPEGVVARYYNVVASDRRLLLAIVLGVIVGSLQAVPYVVSLMYPDQIGGYTIHKYEEVVVRKDMKTKRYGFSYSDDLVVKEIDPHSTAAEAGLKKFSGRRIQKVNGIRVSTVAEFHNAIIKRDQRSSLSYHIILNFTPLFAVGNAVRATKRLTFKYQQQVQQGAVGVILRASLDGKTCTARIGGVVFEGSYSQLETVVDEDVPHKYSKEPSWIRKSDGERDLEVIVSELGYRSMGYFESLIAYGIDRPDLLAIATSQDAEELLIKPHHFKELYSTAKAVVRERKRIYNHQISEDIATNDLTLLAELQAEARKRVLLNAARELEGKPAIPFSTEANVGSDPMITTRNVTSSQNVTQIISDQNSTTVANTTTAVG